jgi:N-acetyl-gamma-glutamyl-phosphate reductase
MTSRKRIGLVGARGYVGRELLLLLRDDPTLELAFIASGGGAGQRASAALGVELPASLDVTLEEIGPEALSARVAQDGIDALVFGLQNGQTAPFLQALTAGGASPVVVDLSADHRFDALPGCPSFTYGLVEKNRAALRTARHVANPGCYATAAQLALWPFEDLVERATIFGVSGWSGAGTRPSRKNDTALLSDNILPYDLVGHTQEREMARHAALDVRFLPHVAGFFRGIHVTLHLDLRAPLSAEAGLERLLVRYRDEPLVTVRAGEASVKESRDTNGCIIGGLLASADGRRLTLSASIDNLRKGAATQALQNVHLALGLPELSGITP